MEFNIFEKKVKIPWFSIIIFVFFLLVSAVSLYIVRAKIIDNSNIMGRQIAASFATKETSKIKTEELILRGMALDMRQQLAQKQEWSDEELKEILQAYTDDLNKNGDFTRFDVCAVIDGRHIGVNHEDYQVSVQDLKWYNLTVTTQKNITYTNLYRNGQTSENVLTLAASLGNSNDVLAINIYPQKLNALLSENQLPEHSYYYLCDPNGNIMFTLNDRALSIAEQQPYVDQILSELSKGTAAKPVSSIIDLEGKKRGVYYAVSDGGWISIVTIPYDYLLADYQNLLEWFIAALVLVLLLAAMLGLREYVLHRQVESFNDVVQVMSRSFLTVLRLNIKTGHYEVLKGEQDEFDGNKYENLLARIIERVEPDAADEFARTFSLENIRSLAADNVYDYGGDFRQRFGEEYKWVNVRLLRDEELLKPYEVIIFLREVEAEKQKELEHLELTEHALTAARENAKARNMFFSAMSHDMRAPLNGIIGMAELAQLHKDDQKQVNDYVGKIKASGKQLLTLINDILEMARLDNGKVEHMQETFDLAEVVRETGDLFHVQAEMQQKSFTQEIFIENELVSGDLQSLHQILNNILSNALKYTPAPGTISFMVRREGGEGRSTANYTFIVKDTGVGMSEKFLEKIFVPFERDQRFGVPKVVGTGLGMAIVKSLVERLDGNIHISSRENEGTCVIISLPFNIVKSAQPEQDTQSAKLSDFADTKVLVAEDNDINMELIDELLTMNGIEVIAAADGQEAVEKFAASEEGSIKLVLMDMQMPRLNGCEATQAIRKLERSDAKRVPIVALTGNVSDDDVKDALQAGMNDYMTKPLKMKLLAQKMATYIKME